MKAVYIMWLRQLKRYWRSRGRMIGFLGQPILFLIALGFGFGPIYKAAGGGDYIQFIAPGIIAMTALFSGMFSGMEVVWDKQFGFLKETLVAPVSRVSIMVGKTLGGATVATIQGIIVFIVCLIIGFRPMNLIYLPMAFVFLFLIAFLFTALATAVASKLEDMQAFPVIMNFIIMPLFFLSGALFPLNNFPRPIYIVSKFNPLSYGVNGLRMTLTEVIKFGAVFDFLILLILSGLIVAIGSYLFSNVEV
ncbi:ABC transporter permease [Candidatus Woesearchaeota archaeon]|nr:ABC transporter permease [Candidatus Woesearchaeota archaeon]